MTSIVKFLVFTHVTPGPPPGRCTNSRFPYPSQGPFSSLSSPQALPNPSRAFFFFFFYANQAGLEPVTSLSPLCLPISYLFSSYANCAIPARLKIQWFFSMLFICKSNSRPSLALENNDVMNLRPRGPAVQRSKNQNKPKFAKRNGNCSLLGFAKDPLRALKKTLTPLPFCWKFCTIMKYLKCLSLRLFSVVITRNSLLFRLGTFTPNSDPLYISYLLVISINHKRLKIGENCSAAG